MVIFHSYVSLPEGSGEAWHEAATKEQHLERPLALCPAPPDVASAEPSGHRPYNSVGWRWSALTLSFRKEKQMDVGQNGRPRGPQMLV